MADVGKGFRSAAVFVATGGIGRALVDVLLDAGTERVHAGGRAHPETSDARIRPFTFDLLDEASIERAVREFAKPPELVIAATGVLTLSGGRGPEKSLRAVEPDVMATAFALNTIGPALIAKHVLPTFPRQGRHVFAALSARVGSIGDNRIGGWHSYRASKAALNMLIRNFAIELGRTRPEAVVVGLHPGTVDTSLSQPYQGNVPDEQLFSPERSAGHLLDVLGKLGPGDSGSVFDWKGERIVD
ncbi:SDR family NAD(P)-dependent oxidoreductase [Alteriqipengyuania flavescens]|uniref:SDR family NAD(P)-dependent oxidoreductase n=1 Tax=Alteriqipengyuania flavescens TaxID=3053610 RepID=UPI0025B4C986|nr:SDR family NAD(P)-dependent oxidoreductase [Alteriqipengyuania flavescens]WJY18451.1 SDR family NAD(P)-dependent oxidoreductase [Alteriqipengyuania flavescens]WJY24392.1 SDR family NAD(P)-dependent oxidoreductase [Alteriqipengyuania flavescens]